MENSEEYSLYLKGVGSKLKELRKSVGLTQEQMAEELGSDYKYYQKIEGGHANIKLSTLYKICSNFSITPGNFLSDDGEFIYSSEITISNKDKKTSKRNK